MIFYWLLIDLSNDSWCWASFPCLFATIYLWWSICSILLVLLDYFSYYWFLSALLVYFLHSCLVRCDLQIFSQPLSFHSFNSFFLKSRKHFFFYQVQFIDLLFYGLLSFMEFGVVSKKSSPNSRWQRFSFGRFIISGFTCRSMTHFELIFAQGVEYE